MLFRFRPSVIVCGAMRTGTNLAKHVITEHSRCRVVFNAHWWKHAPFPFLQCYDGFLSRTPLVVMIKDPVHWSRSIYEFYKARPSLGTGGADYASFLRRPFELKDDARRSLSPTHRFETPLAYYNHYYQSYLSVADRLPLQVVRYEDLTADPDGFLRGVVQERHLRGGPARLPERSVKPSSDRVARTEIGTERPSAYPEVSADDWHFIAEAVDEDLCARFRYMDHCRSRMPAGSRRPATASLPVPVPVPTSPVPGLSAKAAEGGLRIVG